MAFGLVISDHLVVLQAEGGFQSCLPITVVHATKAVMYMSALGDNPKNTYIITLELVLHPAVTCDC